MLHARTPPPTTVAADDLSLQTIANHCNKQHPASIPSEEPLPPSPEPRVLLSHIITRATAEGLPAPDFLSTAEGEDLQRRLREAYKVQDTVSAPCATANAGSQCTAAGVRAQHQVSVHLGTESAPSGVLVQTDSTSRDLYHGVPARRRAKALRARDVFAQLALEMDACVVGGKHVHLKVCREPVWKSFHTMDAVILGLVTNGPELLADKLGLSRRVCSPRTAYLTCNASSPCMTLESCVRASRHARSVEIEPGAARRIAKSRRVRLPAC